MFHWALTCLKCIFFGCSCATHGYWLNISWDKLMLVNQKGFWSSINLTSQSSLHDKINNWKVVRVCICVCNNEGSVIIAGRVLITHTCFGSPGFQLPHINQPFLAESVTCSGHIFCNRYSVPVSSACAKLTVFTATILNTWDSVCVFLILFFFPEIQGHVTGAFGMDAFLAVRKWCSWAYQKQTTCWHWSGFA